MEKWQELGFNFLFNVSVALIAAGILKLVFDKEAVVASVVLTIIGVYSAVVITFCAKYINEKEKYMDALILMAIAIGIFTTLMAVWIVKGGNSALKS